MLHPRKSPTQVQISIKFFSAESLDLTVPISVESESSLLAQEGIEELDVKVFPRIDNPPAYSKLDAYSTPSNKSLRRESAEYVLADPATADSGVSVTGEHSNNDNGGCAPHFSRRKRSSMISIFDPAQSGSHRRTSQRYAKNF